MSSNDAVWVVIPTYNEIDNIATVLDRAWLAMPAANVLIVDDGSPDGTADFVRARSLSDPRLHLLTRSGKLGLGTAYVAGFKVAIDSGADVIVQMDADLSHDPAEIPVLVAATAAADLVIGSRYVEGGRVENWPLYRNVLSRTANRYARNVLGLRTRDVTGGYRAWRADGLASLPLDELRNGGYAFQTEMVLLASRRGLVVTEHPITFRERIAGSSKMRMKEVIGGVVLLLRVRLSHRERTTASVPPSSRVEPVSGGPAPSAAVEGGCEPFPVAR